MFFLLSLLSGTLDAQTTVQVRNRYPTDGWYAGVKGSTLFGKSTFTSFGADKTRVGWSSALFGGYRFNALLSVEAFLKNGQLNLAVRKNDVNADYWLGSDRIRYFAPVIDAGGWDYSNLTSNVEFSSFGLQGNVNLLSLFSPDASRMRVELAPAISAVRTKAAIATIDMKKTVINGEAQWHLGWGAELQACYRLSRHLEMSLYGSFTHLAGNRYDGIPEHIYGSNLLGEGGVRMTWVFGNAVSKNERKTNNE